MKLTPFKLPSLGKRTCGAFVDRAKPGRSGYEQITIDDYAPTLAGDEIRMLRIEAGLTLRAASFDVGLGVVEYSGLENGRYGLPEDQWEWIKEHFKQRVVERKS